MANSIIGRYAAAFEAANIGKGITPSRNIRQERKDAEKLKQKRAIARGLYEDRKEAEFVEEHGMSSSEYRKIQKDADWEEFLGEEPVLEDVNMDWGDALEEAAVTLRRHGEEEGLPEKPSKFFSYWMRHELLYMRGSGSQRLRSRPWSYVDFMDDIRILDGQWQYAVIVQVRPELINKSHERIIDFLELFDQEMLKGDRVRIWFPFATVSADYMYRLAGIRNRETLAFRLVKRKSPAKRVAEFYTLHHLNTVKNNNSFTNLHRRFLALSGQDKKDKAVVDKQAMLNKLWK